MYLHPSLISDLAAANRDDALRRAARPRPAKNSGGMRVHRHDRSRAAPRLRLRLRLSRSI
jgi:hypothetical protein